jgi:U3 small nucleolar RNA-associated protein 25
MCRQVLILLPLRSVALRVVSRLLELAQKENRADSIQNKQRFLEDFGTAETDDEDDQDGGTDNGGAKTGGGRGGPAGGTPAEHAALFGGNSDDHFRLGIKVTRFGCCHLHASGASICDISN